MWKFLHPYAKPETQYRLLGKIQPTLGWLSLILLVIGYFFGSKRCNHSSKVEFDKPRFEYDFK